MGQKYKVIACEAVREELNALLPGCKNTIDVTYMTLGLHSAGHIKMPLELQKAIDAVDTAGFDALLLAYGLCNNGICGLHADIPLVVPRAHDCVTLFMGSKQKYRSYFDANKGSFFVSAGTLWSELNTELLDGGFDTEKLHAEYVELYGEDNADYLLEMLGNPLKQYRQLTLVNNGIGNIAGARERAQEIAAAKAWVYDEFSGSTDLLRRFLEGQWNSGDFLVLPPGSTIERSFAEEEIVKVGGSEVPAEKNG